MSDDPRVQQLLNRLHESQSTPEEVCKSCPELLPEVRRRWRQMCRVRDQLEVLFPTPSDPDTTKPKSAISVEETNLPRIPGYEVESLLGHGGMGVVFRARHLRLNRLVALKMALAGAYAGPQERHRFQREAEAVAGLQHPNVVQIHDVGDSDGRSYFTMEYVEGGSLSQKLSGTPQPAREAAALLATLAGAVQVAHDAGIVHRDLKPANVLLTADGTPKISDFGLARRLDGDAGLTWTGIAIGTPSYMAPEQARGQKLAVGPGVDVYSLGAILYEMLTGRPPFRAETSAETIQQVIHQDPVPPSRLNATVPRDLETICLKCLQKEARLRYVSAAALADDLHRFLSGEAIAARPEGWLGRLIRRIRRRPVVSAAVAIATLSTVALIVGGVWSFSEREAAARAANTKQAVADAELGALERNADADLNEMADLQLKFMWPEAKAALERADSRLGQRGSTQLHNRIAQGKRDLKLVEQWEAIRLRCYVNADLKLEFLRADSEYEAAFSEAGFGQVSDDLEVVMARIRKSQIRNFVVAELDYWAMVFAAQRNSARRDWLLNLSDRADPDSSGWRARAKLRESWQNEASIGKLIETAPVEYPPLLILLKIDRAMTDLGKDSIPLMKRYQQAHSGDFWVNLKLADTLLSRLKAEEAIRYYQAALAIKPKTRTICNGLGVVLATIGRDAESVEHFRLALEANPTNGIIHANFAVALSRMNRHDAAIAQIQIALGYQPESAVLYYAFGHSLEGKGRLDDAANQYRRAVALAPTLQGPQRTLRDFLMRRGQMEEARIAWGKAVEAAPTDLDLCDTYAEYCLFLGRRDEYHRVCRAMLDRFQDRTDPQQLERIGRACLLAPTPANEAYRAEMFIDRALTADKSRSPGWILPYFMLAKSLAELRLERVDTAISILEGDASRVLVPAPQLILAIAQHRKGQQAAARKTLAKAIQSFDWQAAKADNREAWIFHILRREAESLILPNLPAFLNGTYQPKENDERLALLGVCRFTNRACAAARLYADAFAEAPQIADDLGVGHRFNAARAAALAGCGRGADAAALTEPERTRWRAQAREWLWADVTAWKKRLDGDPAKTRESVQQKLSQWHAEPDFAGLREAAALDKLPADERKDCLALWDEVRRILQINQTK